MLRFYLWLAIEGFLVFDERINQILVSYKVKTLKEILQSEKNEKEDVLGSICLQLTLVDIIKELQLFPTGVFGDTSSRIVTAYYNDVIQLKEAVSAAIKLSHVNFDSNTNFQTSPNLRDLDKNLMKEDYSTYAKSIKPSKGTIILNVSDLLLSDEDNLLVENGSVNLLGLLGR